MKAEHRKELQTNALAARMGRFAQQIRQKPQKRTVFWIALVLIVVAIGGGWLYIRGNRIEAEGKRWEAFSRGGESMIRLASTDRDTRPGQAARFQRAWLLLWDLGIKNLAKDPPGSIKTIQDAKKEYDLLAVECQDDPIWSSEARYQSAVALETLAVEDPRFIDEAIAAYRKVDPEKKGDEQPKTARGEQGRDRAKYIEDNRSKVEDFYRDLRFQVGAGQPRFDQRALQELIEKWKQKHP